MPCTSRVSDNGVCAYGQPAIGTYGNARPTSERAPGFQTYGASVTKDFTIWHEQQINFRADADNVFNSAYWSNPGNNVSTASLRSDHFRPLRSASAAALGQVPLLTQPHTQGPASHEAGPFPLPSAAQKAPVRWRNHPCPATILEIRRVSLDDDHPSRRQLRQPVRNGTPGKCRPEPGSPKPEVRSPISEVRTYPPCPEYFAPEVPRGGDNPALPCRTVGARLREPASMLARLLPLLCLLACSAPIVTSATPTPATEHLLWSDEFNGPATLPNPAIWTYETGAGGWGNHELETYCAPTASQPPCNPAQPNATVAPDGYLHITARHQPASATQPATWTSARLTSKGLQSFQYGRIEARIKRSPPAPASRARLWISASTFDAHPWPASGELDVIGEHRQRAPDPRLRPRQRLHGLALGKPFQLPAAEPFASAFHTFGLLWSPGRIQYYVDDPTHPYATFTPADLPPGATWPFDGRRFFLLLNLAIGGDWPGPPDASTPATPEMLARRLRPRLPDVARLSDNTALIRSHRRPAKSTGT